MSYFFDQYGPVTVLEVCAAEQRTRNHSVLPDGSLVCWGCHPADRAPRPQRSLTAAPNPDCPDCLGTGRIPDGDEWNQGHEPCGCHDPRQQSRPPGRLRRALQRLLRR